MGCIHNRLPLTSTADKAKIIQNFEGKILKETREEKKKGTIPIIYFSKFRKYTRNTPKPHRQITQSWVSCPCDQQHCSSPRTEFSC